MQGGTGPATPLARRTWQRRPISPRSPLEGRQLWRIGDWGGASEHIGRRWEELGVQALLNLLDQPRPGPDGETYVPVQAVIISADPDLAAQVHAHGKSHADALLVGTLDGHVVLEPVDFKWTLETADIKQVSVVVLNALMDEPPPLLEEAVARAVSVVRADVAPVRFHDGIFLAPDSAPNRAHIGPHGPMDPVWAALVSVDPEEFFSPLVGWELGRHLSRIERASLLTLELADRYYRLGAGVRGGLRKLAAGLFGEAPLDFDDPAELERLCRNRRVRTVGEIVAFLDRALIGQAELVQRLREIERGAYPYGRFREDLKKRGLEQNGEDRRVGPVYGAIMKEVSARLRAEGLELVRGGASEQDALAALAEKQAHFTALARGLLDQRSRVSAG